MNTKMIALLMLVMFFTAPVLATIVVTPSTPASGTTYNTLPSNVPNVDINFAITDDNGTAVDHNITITIYRASDWSIVQTLVDDVNVAQAIDANRTDLSCSFAGRLAAYGCDSIWDMPGVATMTEGAYYIDVNVVSVSPGGGTQEDTNVLIGINVSNRIASAASIQALLLVISLVVFAGLLIIAVFSIGVLGADPATTAVALVGAGIVAAVLMSILGVIVAMI